MTKRDLIEEIAFSQGLTRSEATRIIDAAITCVQNALVRGEDVRLSGFCTMAVKDRPAKNYRNSRPARSARQKPENGSSSRPPLL